MTSLPLYTRQSDGASLVREGDDPPALATLLEGDAELAQSGSLQRYKDVQSLAKGYLQLEKRLPDADKMVLPPGPDASPKEVRDFFTKMGVPESPEGYAEHLKDFKKPEGLPWDDDLGLHMLASAQHWGIEPAKLKGFLQDFADHQGSTFQALKERWANEKRTADEALAKEWGDKKDVMEDAAMAAAEWIFGDEGAKAIMEVELVDGTALGNQPSWRKGLAKFGEFLIEHDMVEGRTARLGATPADAKKKLDELLNDQAWLAEYAKGSKKHVEQYQELMMAAQGAKQEPNTGGGFQSRRPMTLPESERSAG